jgi:hypothetical protein
MLMAYGFLRRVFEVFERFRTPVDVVTTSEVSVSVTVDDRGGSTGSWALSGFAEVRARTRWRSSARSASVADGPSLARRCSARSRAAPRDGLAGRRAQERDRRRARRDGARRDAAAAPRFFEGRPGRGPPQDRLGGT